MGGQGGGNGLMGGGQLISLAAGAGAQVSLGMHARLGNLHLSGLVQITYICYIYLLYRTARVYLAPK